MVRDLARDVLSIALEGLSGRARARGFGTDETCFLDPLLEIAESGVTPAEELLRLYQGPWKESVDPLFREFAY
jgi:glutamate--cysteine ligase